MYAKLGFGALLALVIFAGAGCKSGGGTINTNLPPVPAFTESIQAGNSPLLVNFDASASTDPDGSIVSYAWDFNGDGTTDFTATTPTVSHVYSLAGTFTPKLTVADNAGAAATISGSPIIITTPSFAPVVADAASGAGNNASLFIVNGNPAVAFDDEANNLGYVRSNDASGIFWATPLKLSTDTVASVALGVADGNPAVVFVNSAGDVRFVRAQDPAGTLWNAPVTIAAAADLAGVSVCNLLIAGGNPATVFTASDAALTSAEVFYIRADDADGAAWTGAPVAVSSPLDVSTRALGFTAGGKPNAVFLNSAGLLFKQASDAAGAVWPASPVVVDGTLSFIENAITATEIGGRPALSYRHSGLFYDRASDAAGSSWPAPQKVVDDAAAVAESPSLAQVAGVPMIAFRNNSLADLELLVGVDAAGTSFNGRIIVASGRPDSLSLADIGAKPALAFKAHTDGLEFVLAR